MIYDPRVFDWNWERDLGYLESKNKMINYLVGGQSDVDDQNKIFESKKQQAII